MILLDAMTTGQVLGLLLGGGTVGVILTTIITWLRFRKKDTSDTRKVDAETQKIKMEALQIKAQAEVTISEAALKLVQRITEECDEIRKNVDRLEQELVNLNKELSAERQKNMDLLAQIEILKRSK